MGTNAVVEYLAALDRGDLTAAEACFAETAVYAVPPTPDEPMALGFAADAARLRSPPTSEPSGIEAVPP